MSDTFSDSKAEEAEEFDKGVKDNIDHPGHYNREGAMETIDEMVLLFGPLEVMIFCKLNAWKYRARAICKNGEEDLKKSDWYLKKYKELKENDESRAINNESVSVIK